jgi:hypothetical protein
MREDYEVIFDSENPNWFPDSEISLLFLQTQENWMNDLLKARGHVFLNEVFTALGFPHTPAGAVTGWTMSENGDHEIMFNPVEVEGGIRLEFNVDGFILDKLGGKKVVR